MKLEKQYLMSLIEQELQEQDTIGSNLKSTSRSAHQANLRQDIQKSQEIDLDPKERDLLINIKNLLTKAASNPDYKLDRDQRVISLMRQLQKHLQKHIPSK